MMSKLESLQKHDNQDIANSAGRALFVINPDSELSFLCVIIIVNAMKHSFIQ